MAWKMKFDYSKTYYKVTNEKENHHNFQYEDGLNILKQKFNNNPMDSCVRGGFYFTDENNILEYLSYGCWIREVSIPHDTQVILDPSGDKWRTNGIILGKKYTIPEFLDFYFDNLFDKEKFDYANRSGLLAIYCCDYFNKWFDKEKYNYKENSWELAAYCSNHFGKWFDKKKFNYEKGRKALAGYCSKYYDKWIQK